MEEHTLIPRPEYPRPRFVRHLPWQNLNGRWRFAFDPGKSAAARGLARNPELYDREILVPFCPESRCSTIECTDFIEACAYCREFEIPASWAEYRILLHFDAVDYRCRVYVDGVEVGGHAGGGTGFEFELDIVPGKHLLAVLVADEVRSGRQGAGKQCASYASFGCDYTRVTGIWRTVWLETVADGALRSCGIVPNIDTGCVLLTPEYYRARSTDRLQAAVLDGGVVVAEAEYAVAAGMPLSMAIPAPVKLWSPESPFRYELRLRIERDGAVVDEVSGYFGMRKIHCENGVFHLNNRPFFARLVLDQGYDPEGLWTAPSDAAFEDMIRKAKALGFNGARLHQKLFEDRYLDWADRLGFVVWSEYPSWGLDLHAAEARENFLREWREAVAERVNHPSVIAWVPFNETFLFPTPEGKMRAFPDPEALAAYRNFITEVYDLTRQLDPSRPVCDASGWYHVKTDLWAVHLYRPDAAALRTALRDDAPFVMVPEYEAPYGGQPFFVDEWGGFRFVADPARQSASNAWGYGTDPETREELLAKIAEQLDVLLETPGLQGYCYTQLTDIEQEENGLLTPEREPKAPFADFYRLFSRQPKDFCYETNAASDFHDSDFACRHRRDRADDSASGLGAALRLGERQNAENLA